MFHVDSYKGLPSCALDASCPLTPAPLREKEASRTPGGGLLPVETSLAFGTCLLCSLPPGEGGCNGDTFGPGEEGCIHPPVTLGVRCSELGRGAQAGHRGLIPNPSQAVPTPPHSSPPQLPGLPVASLAPESPEGLQSPWLDLTALPGNDTTSAGRPRAARAGKSGFISQDRQTLDHDCRPAAYIAVLLRQGPVHLGRSLLLSPAPSTVAPRPPLRPTLSSYRLFSLEILT